MNANTPPPNRQYLEKLLIHDVLDPRDADDASKVLGFYPSRSSWLEFFDKALLIIGGVCLLLALVFFIAYNWVDMGKMGKFALVEGGLVISVAGYAILAYRQKFRLAQQLLLLIASVITGSLLALFGQVYQTGADTWQLFFSWALLITPFVIVARLPALWLLWLGLINACIMQYTKVMSFFWLGETVGVVLDHIYTTNFYHICAFITNLIAINLWLKFMEKKSIVPLGSTDYTKSNRTPVERYDTHNPTTHNPITHNPITHNTKPTSKASYHWSTYVVGLVLTYFATRLGIKSMTFYYYDSYDALDVIAFLLWIGWVLFMYWRHRRHHVDLLMLTYMCVSVIFVVVMRLLSTLGSDSGTILLVAMTIIGMSAGAVVWLRNIAQQDKLAQRTVHNTAELHHDS